MKIAFFTEGQAFGKVPRDYNNMRTDMAWICASNATRIPYYETKNIKEKFDLGVCIIPKRLDLSHKHFALEQSDIPRIKGMCTKVISMQEGPHWYFQDYPLEQQIWYYNLLHEMDELFVHNEIDATYFRGLTGKQCKVMRTLIIEDCIKDIPKNNQGSGVMIGGNFCHWYGGFDSYIVAQEFNEQIHVPSMGRKIEGEEQMENLSHLPYMTWNNWMAELSKRKYGVHLMRTQAAGTFALNCAYFGIPCIGYQGLDTQEICHPLTTVKVGDIVHAKELAHKLKTVPEFYKLCSETAQKRYNNEYKEEVWLERFKSQI
tara:strand:+ start:339 stop:1286 length:948 start_codon:yes stop_codon:yes gene_type:complete